MSHLVTGSGYLNSPVRTLLIADDNRPGSYPVQISPQTAAKSGQFTKPYRDNVMPDTPVVYARAKVTFSGIPGGGESITVTNAASIASTFTFRTNSSNLVAGPNSYNVNLFALDRTKTQYDTGLTTAQVLIKRAAERFITAVNSATGSLITASSTDKFNVVMLTQNIPGSTGNTTNSYVTDGEFVVENFTGGNSGTVRYPFGISIGSAGEVLDRVLSTDVSGTLDVPTSGKAGLLSAYSDQHPYGVFQPYDESRSHQAFGVHTGGVKKYGTQAKLSDEFFTRGSVSGSLNEPLWVKDKIVIDLNPIQNSTIVSLDTADSNYPMCYYNFAERKWDPLGQGINPSSTTTFQEELDATYAGIVPLEFNSAVAADAVSNIFDVNITNERFKSTSAIGSKRISYGGIATPTNAFGFPYNAKYHATASQCLSVSDVIDRPFVLEKFVYEFSGSTHAYNGNGFAGTARAIVPPIAGTEDWGLTFFHCATFFILNQRKANTSESVVNTYYSRLDGKNWPPYPLSGSISIETNSNIPSLITLSKNASPTYVNDIRDLVTFSTALAIPGSDYETMVDLLEDRFPHFAQYADLVVTGSIIGTYSSPPIPDFNIWSAISGTYTIASNIKSPAVGTAAGRYGSFPGSGTPAVWSSFTSATRNGLDIPTGRSLINENLGQETAFTHKLKSLSTDETSFYPANISKNSPYLIMPGDKLVFGWQVPIKSAPSEAPNALTIHPGKGKIILYGSYLRDDKPVHDIYKDQLNSDAIHEAIPTGPWVLDRFESEPQMMYSSSMREEHVTGTMVTRGADGNLVVTDVSDIRRGGVRAVSARASDGNLGFRYSFFRDSRLVDSEEQYYDSMQPNPIDILFSDSNVRIYTNFLGKRGTVLLGLPDETLVYGGAPLLESALNNYKNKTFFTRYPFQSEYMGIDRVKKINSIVLSGRRLPGFRETGATPSPIELNESFLEEGIKFLSGTTPGNSISNFYRKGGLTNTFFPVAFSSDPVTEPTTDTNPVPGIAPLPGGDGIFYYAQRGIDAFPENVNYSLSRFMGCFGDGYMRMCQFLPPPGLGIPSIVYSIRYRGTKYGLINPTPLFSSAVFSGTRYGQFRDMMEQRQYTRFSLNNNTLTDAAVSVEFINRSAAPGTLNVVSGSFTNSSNISKFATSEHPYDDALSDYGQIWDRSTVLPETLTAL